MTDEEKEQELAAQKMQAIQRGNLARAEVDAKKALADSKVWKAVTANKPDVLKKLLADGAADMGLANAEGATPLQASVLGKSLECAKALVSFDGALGVPEDALSCWQTVQKDKLPLPEGDEGEPKDPADPEYQAALAGTCFASKPLMEAGHIVKAIVEIGLFYGGRETIEGPEKTFDTMVGNKKGYGVSLLPSGDVYAGEYEGGARSGVGALRTASKTLYAGDWLEGKRHGIGSMTYADGGIYTGSWSYGKRHGVGTFFYANGDSYAGLWHAGSKHGEGKYTATSAGCVYEGTWKFGELLASKVTFLTADKAAYYGAFDKAGRPSGEGTFAFGNGVTLNGTYTGSPLDAPEGEEAPEVTPALWAGGACGVVEGSTDKELKAKHCSVKPLLNVIICGAPASGKGTQCKKIVEKYGLCHVSTGDILRREKDNPDNALAQEANLAEIMATGGLVPDDVITKILVGELASPACVEAGAKESGWLLDGYPRTGAQGDALGKEFLIPSKCILLDVPEEILVARVTGRRHDPETGNDYHLEFNPPKGETDEETEAILARLTQRDDDTEEALKKRLVNFNANKAAIEAKFSSIAMTVDGNRSVDEVWADIDAFLSAK